MGFSRTSGATCGSGGCPAEPAAHPDLLDFITCIRAPQSTVHDCSLGIMGGSGPFSSCQSSRAEGLTPLSVGWSWDGAGVVGSLKATAGPQPLCPTADTGMFHGIMIAQWNLTARRTAACCCLQNTISGTITIPNPRP